MWKHGFLLTENKQKSGDQLVELKAYFTYSESHLYRKASHARMTLYFLRGNARREIIMQQTLLNGFWIGHDRIFLKPSEKLMMAFHGVKKKEHAMLAESVQMNIIGHNEDLSETREQLRVIRHEGMVPFESFRHKFHQAKRQHAQLHA